MKTTKFREMEQNRMSHHNPAEIEFPVDWTYRIICENNLTIEAELKQAMDRIGEHHLHKGNLSKTGKYITFKVIKKDIRNLVELRTIPNELKCISGVKQIL